MRLLHALPTLLLPLLQSNLATAFSLGPAATPCMPIRASSLVRRLHAPLPVTLVASEDGEQPDEQPQAEQMLQQVKDAGIAGVVSYFLVECTFFAIAMPVGYFGWHQTTGEWLDPSVLLRSGDDEAKIALVALIVGYIFALKTLLPVRLGGTLLLTPYTRRVIDRVTGGKAG